MTITETRGMEPQLLDSAAVQARDREVEAGTDRPRPEWVRGTCPRCGDDVVSNLWYIDGKGYVYIWTCWSSLGKNPTCQYRKVP